MKTILILLFCILICNAQEITIDQLGTISTSGIVGLWHMNIDEDPITDSSGNGNTGALGGADFTAMGKFSNAYDFIKANDDHITIANESNFDFDYDDTFSIAAWVNTDVVSVAWYNIFSKLHIGGNYTGYFLFVRDGAIAMRIEYIHNTERIRREGATVIDTATWYFVVMTYAGTGLVSGIELYLNAIKDTPYTDAETDTITHSILNDDAAVIGEWGTGGDNWDGYLDEVAIFNRVLSAAEIKDIYIGVTE